MSIVVSSLTVYFENPFWVGVYERRTKGNLEVCRIVFGAEPKDYELYEWLLKNWNRMRFSPPMRDSQKVVRVLNPKRVQRAIERQLSQSGVGTKAQQALQLQREEHKQERQTAHRQKSDAEKERRFAIRQEQKKEKHRGR